MTNAERMWQDLKAIQSDPDRLCLRNGSRAGDSEARVRILRQPILVS